jgi:hypothetical protein
MDAAHVHARAGEHGAVMRKTIALLMLALLLGVPGCRRYWQGVDKLQDENAELQDELKWQTRDEDAESRKAAEENTPPPDAPLKPGEF